MFCSSSQSLATVSRFMGLGTVKAIGAAFRVGIGFTCGLGKGFEGNIFEVEVGGTIIGRGLETAAPVLSPIGVDAF